MDFDFKTYTRMLDLLITNDYKFIPYKLYNHQEGKIVILRHDVDRAPYNSLCTAEIERKLGIKGTYYFRIVPISFDKMIIKKIENLEHEIGYHYEDVELILKSQKSKIKNQKGNIDEEKLIDLAYKNFCDNLDIMRKITDIKTICMHGSPLSKYDNKIIWKKYDYYKLNIIGEPYLDLNWDEWFYLTDTGRRWNGEDVSIRDKIDTKFKFNFKSTIDIIHNIQKLPDKILITIHPQRWNDNYWDWSKELITQSAKNIIKKYFLVKR